MHMEIQKQMFGKQMFARPYREKGTQRGILANCARFLPVYNA